MANDLNAPRISSRIDGAARNSESGEAFDRPNLNDGIAGRFAATGSVRDMLDAINSANRAFASFNESLAKDRGHRLQKTAAITEGRKADFFDEWGEEIGSPIRKAKCELRKALGMPRSAFAGMGRRVAGATRSTTRCLTTNLMRPSSAPATPAAVKALKLTQSDRRIESANNINLRAVV